MSIIPNYSWGTPIQDPMQGMGMMPSFGTDAMAPNISSTFGSPSGMPGVGGMGGALGLNLDTAKLGLSGIGAIGSLWGAFQAASLAKKQFNYTKSVGDTNMANQLKTYNTGLTDRANNRAIVEGRTPEQTKSYIDANQLTRYGR